MQNQKKIKLDELREGQVREDVSSGKARNSDLGRGVIEENGE